MITLFKVAQNSFQHFLRRRFRCIIITTLYQLLLQSWYQITAQSLVNNFRKFNVALNSMYRIFLNFAKSCILSCLSKFHNKKKFHRAVFEI